MLEITGAILLALLVIVLLPFILTTLGIILAIPFFAVKVIWDDTRNFFTSFKKRVYSANDPDRNYPPE